MSSSPPIRPGTSAFDRLLQQADGLTATSPAEGQQIMRAGTEIERGEIRQWAERLGPAYTTLQRTRFPAWLRQVFPGQARPDMVAINPRRRTILVGDVTAQPNADHLQKTINYARRLAANLPQQYRGFRVLAQERYWGLAPERRRELGMRGTSNVSRRFVVQREAEGFAESEIRRPSIRGGRRGSIPMRDRRVQSGPRPRPWWGDTRQALQVVQTARGHMSEGRIAEARNAIARAIQLIQSARAAWLRQVGRTGSLQSIDMALLSLRSAQSNADPQQALESLQGALNWINQANQIMVSSRRRRESEALFEAEAAPPASAAEMELERLLRRVDRAVARSQRGLGPVRRGMP